LRRDRESRSVSIDNANLPECAEIWRWRSILWLKWKESALVKGRRKAFGRIAGGVSPMS